MVVDCIIWVLAGLLALPHVVLSVGWLIYLFARHSTRTNYSSLPNEADLNGVDIVIPIRNEGVAPSALLDDLRPAHERGAQIVLLNSHDSIPSSQTNPELNRHVLKVNPTWQFTEQGWWVHCWGPPPPGYKAGVTNLWLRNTDAEIVVVIDADWRVAVNHIAILVASLLSNPQAAFAQGNWGFLNAEDSWVAKAESASLRLHHHVEQKVRADYDIPFNLNGSFMALRREPVLENGGFDGSQLSEDVDLAYRLYQRGYSGVYVPGIEGRGTVASSISQYRTQKVRWAAGRQQALWRHGIPILTNGSILARLLGLHYLLEYATGPSTLVLVIFTIHLESLTYVKALLLLSVLSPGFLRAALTFRENSHKYSVKDSLLKACGDWLLRSLLFSTNFCLTIGSLIGKTPQWQWEHARFKMISLSILLLGLVFLIFPSPTDCIGNVARVLLILGLGTGLVLWGWPSNST